MILLTGGTGFVGRHLVTKLLADGHRIRVLSRSPAKFSLPDGASWQQGDLTDPASLAMAMQGIETVVHAGALLRDGPTPEATLEKVNAGGTEAIACAARNMNVRRFIHVSSAGVYGDGYTSAPNREIDPPQPSTGYERSKLFAERALISALTGSEVQWTILRPQGLYAADRPETAAFFRQVAQKSLWFHGPLSVMVHPTHISDLTRAIGLVLERDGLEQEVINIGGAQRLEYRELISLIGANVGNTPYQLCAPSWTGKAAALAVRTWAFAENPPALLARLSRSWVNRTVNIDKARNLLGFEPLALEAGLCQTAEELRRMALL